MASMSKRSASSSSAAAEEEEDELTPTKRNKRSRAESTPSGQSSSTPSGTNPFVVAEGGFHMSRVRTLTAHHRTATARSQGTCVVLWMSRDQRVYDNYALFYAQSVARTHGVPVNVVFNLVPKFLQATLRQYDFMLKGLQEVERNLRSLNIPFHLLMGDPVENVSAFASSHDALMVVADFSPLRVSSGWTMAVANRLDQQSSKIPLVQVDAHNIVPCWVASPKLEYSARTFRGKITPKISEYLKEIPSPWPNPAGALENCPEVDWNRALDSLEINRDILPVDWLVPGQASAHRALEDFLTKKIKDYDTKRNDPNANAVSHLSPFLHFGQLSAQRIVFQIKSRKIQGTSADSFIEELVVRRELTDNFCFYNPHYDSLQGCYEWAQETLSAHRADPRPVVYTQEQLENALTHDDLWNAAQIQMLREGKMHGFLRMYWAKKILEWTNSPDEALRISIYLNDKYQLDGRDPNGYVGCMWSIGGIHDQGWGERAIFGKIRYMNYQGCQRKFDVKKFVNQYSPAAENAAKASGQKTIKYSKK